jgi:hypothetical protein
MTLARLLNQAPEFFAGAPQGEPLPLNRIPQIPDPLPAPLPGCQVSEVEIQLEQLRGLSVMFERVVWHGR